MDQKQTLWIIAAVGIFLLVVIGAALILYSPAMQTEPAVTAVQLPAIDSTTDTYTIDSVAQAPIPTATQQTQLETQQADSTVPVKDLTVISDTTNVYGTGQTNIDLNSLKSVPTAETVKPQNETAEKAVEEKKTVVTITQKTQPKPAPAQPVAPGPKKVTEQPVAKPAVKPVPAIQYWVQAASFTSKNNAESARKSLEDNKIPSEIFTYTDDKGKTFYRVRIGPYTTKNEAEYWRTRIAMIDTFSASNSYITESRTAN